jgi:zinc protease
MYLLVQGGADDAADRLADMGSSLYTNNGLESAALDGFSLRDDFDRTLDLWAGVLNNPGMFPASLDRIRAETEGTLLQSSADPRSVAWRVFQVAARGSDHPYARRPTAASYGNVTVDDCQKFIREFVQVGGLHLYVAGDITHDEVTEKLAALIPAGPTSAPAPIIPRSSRDGAAVTFVNMPGASQAEILMWAPAPSLDAMDYNAAWTMLSIFAGNSITSRLGSDLREMMGSTYSVQGQLVSWKADTMLTVEVPVQADKTAAAMMAMVTGAATMRETDVTDDELSLVRDGAIAALPSRFATVLGTLNAFRQLVYYHLPTTYFEDLPGRLAAVDKAAIRQAASDYLPRLGLQFVVVGDATEVLPMLIALTASDGALPGTLRTVDVEGRPVNLR